MALLARARIAFLGAALLASAEPSSASIIVDDTFPIDTGYYVFGNDPEAPGIPPQRVGPGVAVEFRTHDSITLEALEVALNLYEGANVVDVSLHQAEPYLGHVRPGAVIESFHLVGALAADTRVITLTSLLQPILAADTSYFVSATIPETTELHKVRWAVGTADYGYRRAYMRLDRSWDTFAFTSFPRTALRVIAVPEPSTLLLFAPGLVTLSVWTRCQRASRRSRDA